jgi:hypothetical protein
VEQDRTVDAVSHVTLTEYFRLAMIVALRASSPPGPGSNSTIGFCTVHDPTNAQDLNRLRPPAIGLAHELVHALHNAAGDQPGDEFGAFTTTLTELLAVGLGPFQAEAVSENTLRAAWPPPGVALVLLDNRPAPRRSVYEPPVAPETPETMRDQYHTI